VVTVELARRLIESGVPLADIEAALLLVVERGLPLSEALAERDKGLLSRVAHELSRSDLPSVLTVRASPELNARLPDGMCLRLLAVPVHVDPRTGRVDVAAVEPLDPHIAQEFAYHLDQPVRVLHASRDAVRGALVRLQQRTKVSVLPPDRAPSDFGSDAPIPLVKADPAVGSDAPIPLVRRSLVPPAGFGQARAPSALPAQRSSAPPASLPVAEGAALSWRSKPPPADLIAEVAQQTDARPRPPSLRAPPVAEPSLAERFEQAATPERVVELLRDALVPALSIVFTIKNASFDGRMASAVVEQHTPAKQISLLSHQPSVLETALKAGFYLGPIPNTPNHRELRDALPPDTAHEVYVTLVSVSDRPSLAWLIAGFERSLELTRRADEVALFAGRALARIVRDRKRGG
jgi:hypothetical protein